MSVDWTQFTPFTSLADGVAIGLAAALCVFGAGRIAGIAAVVGSALQSLRMRPSAPRCRGSSVRAHGRRKVPSA